MELSKENLKDLVENQEKQIKQDEGRLAAYINISNGKDKVIIETRKELEQARETIKRLENENAILKSDKEALENRRVVRLADQTKSFVDKLTGRSKSN